MKLKVYTINKAASGEKDMPEQFNELVRPDVVRKAVEAISSNKRQPYGAKSDAGMRASAELSRRRRKYRGSYGHGISRVQRKILSRRGSQMYWVGAVTPGTVGGRRAHPPKELKEWSKKLNKKERRKAVRSAMAATVTKELVMKRGHNIPPEYPFIIHNNIESLKKTKEAREALEKLGLKDELTRASRTKIRAGKGKSRGRPRRRKKGPLIVVSGECGLSDSCRNIPGVEVVEARNLNADLLAPGADLGRLTLYTEGAIDIIAKERLFMKDHKSPRTPKKGNKSDENSAGSVKSGTKGKAPAGKPRQPAKKAGAAKGASSKEKSGRQGSAATSGKDSSKKSSVSGSAGPAGRKEKRSIKGKEAPSGKSKPAKSETARDK
ncbi:MAG: 50S ribosomal protein L4 [Candidatus Woesearchaeota archaeon]